MSNEMLYEIIRLTHVPFGMDDLTALLKIRKIATKNLDRVDD